MAVINSTMKTYTGIIFSSLKRGSVSLRCFELLASLGWGAVNNSS